MLWDVTIIKNNNIRLVNIRCKIIIINLWLFWYAMRFNNTSPRRIYIIISNSFTIVGITYINNIITIRHEYKIKLMIEYNIFCDVTTIKDSKNKTLNIRSKKIIVILLLFLYTIQKSEVLIIMAQNFK
jgi:hypothetical protein